VTLAAIIFLQFLKRYLTWAGLLCPTAPITPPQTDSVDTRWL